MIVLGVNTARALRWKEGSISRDQIGRVRDLLGPYEQSMFKVVCTHHPFLPPPDSPETGLVRRAGHALRTFESVGVDLLLAGHLHRAYTGDVVTHHARSDEHTSELQLLMRLSYSVFDFQKN